MGVSNLRISCWNMRGFSSAVPYLRSLCKISDIICISEHWLHENRLGQFEEVSEKFLYCARSSKYASAENYGTKRGQGGVAILWSKDLGGVSQISDIKHDRMCGLRVQTNRNLIINIISVYLPAQGSPESYTACIDDLCEFVESRELGSKTIICGDMNGDIGNLCGGRSTKEPSQRGKILFDFYSNYNLSPANSLASTKGPIETFVGPKGSSTIDYILVPTDIIRKVRMCKVIGDDQLNCSDHFPVWINLNTGSLLPTTKQVKPTKITKWDKVSKEDMAVLYTNVVEHYMQDILTFTGQVVTPKGIDDAIEKIVCVLVKASKAIPTTCFRPNLKPYWNSDLSELKRVKVGKFKAWKMEGRPRDPMSKSLEEHKKAKKAFSKAIKQISKDYENSKMIEAIESNSVDRSVFWRHLKKCRSATGSKILAIKNKDDKVVYEITDILDVWKRHFAILSTPKDDSNFDKDHFDFVNEKVNEYNKGTDDSIFLANPFNTREVQKAVDKLHKKKACGFDGISAEHVKYGGNLLIITITMIFNLICRMEYVPVNFRRGIQIPLFKGKNLCSTDTNSYRGISLLSTFNKIYEMLIWTRLESWWSETEVVSRFQGACRKGQSCVHTSLQLQETVSSALETNSKVFVSYFDVSKAFDTVWINGLFYKLYEIGVRGKLWRIMYRTYIDFCCKVRVADNTSEWYPMLCGIHQGGFLSLTKYITFINDLLVDLENTKLCCMISNIPSNPAGYADDLAAATTSKFRTDKVHIIVNEYGRKWRFNFNASKSAVMVFGEDKKANGDNKKYRVFKLGNNLVKEKDTYDHVGVKMHIFNDNTLRVEEKISKGRKSLNASTGLGIRKNGLNMMTCNKIFWQVVVPTVTFGSEVWVMSEKDEENLLSFQRYAGRKIQRFPQRAPSSSSFYGLGWLKLTSYIHVKKLIFIRSILKMDGNNVIRKIFELRLSDFINDRQKGRLNKFRSPVFDILNVAVSFGLFKVIQDMFNGQIKVVSKSAWSKIIWERAWKLDDADWSAINSIFKDNDLLVRTMGNTRYLNWWALSDMDYRLVGTCETMAKIVCHSSRLKRDDYRLKGMTMSNKTCIMCSMYCIEDIIHILTQCPYYHDDRNKMYEEIFKRCPNARRTFEGNTKDVPYYLLGQRIPEWDDEEMLCLWCISGSMICDMYNKAIANRVGVG